MKDVRINSVEDIAIDADEIVITCTDGDKLVIDTEVFLEWYHQKWKGWGRIVLVKAEEAHLKCLESEVIDYMRFFKGTRIENLAESS